MKLKLLTFSILSAITLNSYAQAIPKVGNSGGAQVFNINNYRASKFSKLQSKVIEKKLNQQGVSANDPRIDGTVSGMNKAGAATLTGIGLAAVASDGSFFNPSSLAGLATNFVATNAAYGACLSFNVAALPCMVAGAGVGYFAGSTVSLSTDTVIKWTFGNGNSNINYVSPGTGSSSGEDLASVPIGEISGFVAGQTIYQANFMTMNRGQDALFSTNWAYLRDIAYTSMVVFKNYQYQSQMGFFTEFEMGFGGINSFNSSYYPGFKHYEVKHYTRYKYPSSTDWTNEDLLAVIQPTIASFSCPSGIASYSGCLSTDEILNWISASKMESTGSNSNTSTQILSGNITTAINDMPLTELAKSLNPEIVSKLANDLWQKASTMPGYGGVPFNTSNPITKEDVKQVLQENPALEVKVGDFLAPPASAGEIASPSPRLINSTQPVLDPITGEPLPTPNDPSNPTSGETKIDLGPDPGIGTPGLTNPPTVAEILGPIFAFRDPFKNLNFSAGGSCTEFTFDIWGKQYNTKICDFLEQHRSTIQAIANFIIAAVVILIILSA